MTSGRESPSFASHAATYAIGNIARRIVGFLMLPIYTRYLTTADYGTVGLLAFALALLEPFFGARLAQAIPKFYFDAATGYQKRAVIWSALILTGIVSAATTVVIFALRYPASQLLFGSQKYALATGLFAVNMLSQPIEYTGMTYVRLQERSRLFLGISMAKMFLQILLNILLVVFWRLSVVGVVLSGIISSLSVGVGLTGYIAFYNRPAFDLKTTREMLRFCWPIWFAGVAGLYVGSSGTLYLRVFDSLSDVGLLELGLKFATVVGLLVWTPFFQHWEPVSYRYYGEDFGRDKFRVAFIAMSALMFVVGLGISMFSAPVIQLMAAPPFHAAAGTVPTLTLGLILNNLASFFYFSFLVTQRTKLYGACYYITAGIITIAYFLLIPTFGLEGAVVGQCLAFAVSFLYVYFWSKRYYDPGFNLAPVCIFVLIAAAAYLCSNVFFQSKNMGVSLFGKAVIFVVASSVMVLVGIHAIRKSSPVAYESMQPLLRRVGLEGFLKQPRGEG